MAALTVTSAAGSWSGDTVLTFEIPVGFTTNSAVWNVTSTVTGWVGRSYSNSIEIDGDTVTQSGSGNGAWDYSLPLSFAQVMDLNAAVGTTISVPFVYLPSPGGSSQTVTACTLEVTGSAPTDYCGEGGSLTVKGTLTRGGYYISYPHTIPHENCPITVWFKMCTGPMAVPCGHNPTNFQLFPGSQICIDGTIVQVQTTTDCNGNFSVTQGGSITGFAVSVGNFVANPDYTGCDEDFRIEEQYGGQWTYSPDTLVSCGCAGNIGFNVKYTDTNGNTTEGADNYQIAGIDSAAWIFAYNDPGGPCVGTYGVTGPCFPCEVSGPAVFGQQNVPVYNQSSQSWQADPISGTVTVDIWEHSPVQGVSYYVKDGQYYTVVGVGIVVSDACGNTDMTYGGSPTATTDWYNWVSGSVSIQNWAPSNCTPPLNTWFLGPDGVHNLMVQGPFDVLPAEVDVLIYPGPFSMAGLCKFGGVHFGVELQPPCLGVTADRLQADLMHDVLALAWIESGALKTSVHRSPRRHIGSSTVGWEAVQTVEAANADDIGLTFLPNESLYLAYLLNGNAVYRLNQSFGSGANWSGTNTPNPAVARHSGSGRAEDQAFRFRALGTPVANGNLEFSQCRDNRGALWTAPVVVTTTAQGPYCGGVFVEKNKYVCLFSLAQTVIGLGAAGEIMLTISADGGATWSTPTFTGFFGQCNGIVRTHQGVLVAVVQSIIPISGFPGLFGTGFIHSHNGGLGWSNDSNPTLFVPGLPNPPVLAAQGDIVYCCWASGGVPQFLASQDGGLSWF